MKTLLTITILLFSLSLQAQTKFEKDIVNFRYSTEPRYSADSQLDRVKVKVKHFEDLTDREKWLLLEKIEDAYFTFHKKELEPSTLLAYMESENPIVEWTGKHEEGEDKKMIKYYTVDRKHILNIFDL